MDHEDEQIAADREFWKAIRKSASLVENNPSWMQAGVVVSENFVGGRRLDQPKDDSGSEGIS